MSLAIQDLTACSRAEGLSDIMARHGLGGGGGREQGHRGVWCHGETTNQNGSNDSSGITLRSTKSIKSSWKKDANA